MGAQVYASVECRNKSTFISSQPLNHEAVVGCIETPVAQYRRHRCRVQPASQLCV